MKNASVFVLQTASQRIKLNWTRIAKG